MEVILYVDCVTDRGRCGRARVGSRWPGISPYFMPGHRAVGLFGRLFSGVKTSSTSDGVFFPLISKVARQYIYNPSPGSCRPC
jgi:hypothetical protein